MFTTALFLASALTAAPVTTIVIDQRENCGIGRVAEFYQKRAERDAREVKRDLEAKGKTVRIIKVAPGTKIGEYGDVLIMNPAC